MTTILVGVDHSDVPDASVDFAVESVLDVEPVVNQLLADASPGSQGAVSAHAD
jgi:hypothetical protein